MTYDKKSDTYGEHYWTMLESGRAHQAIGAIGAIGAMAYSWGQGSRSKYSQHQQRKVQTSKAPQPQKSQNSQHCCPTFSAEKNPFGRTWEKQSLDGYLWLTRAALYWLYYGQAATQWSRTSCSLGWTMWGQVEQSYGEAWQSPKPQLQSKTGRRLKQYMRCQQSTVIVPGEHGFAITAKNLPLQSPMSREKSPSEQRSEETMRVQTGRGQRPAVKSQCMQLRQQEVASRAEQNALTTRTVLLGQSRRPTVKGQDVQKTSKTMSSCNKSSPMERGQNQVTRSYE